MSERKLSEMLALVAVIDPDEYSSASATLSSSEINMAYHREVLFIVQSGDMNASSALQFRIYEAENGNKGTVRGTYKLLKAITDLDGADDNKQVIINVRADDLSAGYNYIKGELVLSGNASAVSASAVALADRTRFSDAVTSTSYGDLSTVDEIVA